MRTTVLLDPRMGASLLRLFFHDCFGCDASVLLDDTATFNGEKNAGPNANSLRGFEVIDTIKAEVELQCPGTVSCADILALAARDGVALVSVVATSLYLLCSYTDNFACLGGPSWRVPLGRRDATTASQSAANSNLPSPASNLSQLIAAFAAKGLNARDMTALSGAHTIGQARCVSFRSHIYNDANVDAGFASQRQRNCPSSGGDNNLAPLDVQTPNTFDNTYFRNLIALRELFNNGTQDALVQQYSTNAGAFAADFAAAMVRMGNISPLTGSSGEIRSDCRRLRQTLLPLLPRGYFKWAAVACTIVRQTMRTTGLLDPRMGASLLRLFFHDCFGCDASVLLDDTATFNGEKNAGPNANSLRGFEVIDTIKAEVELQCPGTVSCADILALAARDGVALVSVVATSLYLLCSYTDNFACVLDRGD
ncbi:Peroxidase [Musa troglodytarum]|uniref:peroxidase n=1 Tax=Musa troglodytarum TaxID=320322 RepID=A0A9E7I9P2_9LILI|nr:Peroxidase [Musa troglodytarum]